MPLIFILFAVGIASAYGGRDISAAIYFTGSLVIFDRHAKNLPDTAKRLAYISSGAILCYIISGPIFTAPRPW